MSTAAVRIGVGARFVHEGGVVEIVEMLRMAAGNEVVLRSTSNQDLLRVSLRELLTSARMRPIPDTSGPAGDDPVEPADVLLTQLSEAERDRVRNRAAHVREVLTGYRSGARELSRAGEPRPEYAPGVAMYGRYAAKAAELGVTARTVQRWVRDFQDSGEAGLVPHRRTAQRGHGLKVDRRWTDIALEVMVEHTGESTPSRTMVIDRTNARVLAQFGDGVVKVPSRATAFRVLEQLERRHPTFRLSARRNRDIAERPAGVYGKLRPTRPGEYVLMDSTRLDVFALDPVTLRWINCELTVAMDWYTRCVTGIRLTPVSTKAVDVASVLFQVFRPRPAGADWPEHAVWPAHGIPRTVLLDVDAVQRPAVRRPGCRVRLWCRRRSWSITARCSSPST
ncbi:helix-turn-helix domain-containing protein [Saccharothrix sp. NRRL B-16348]|uniref:helix-turn-helix domain-containing protein n=1 Tax=Saccharothrix sp. NRRL B-16348 TaxID=1415542 RepID=UPI000AB7AFD7|nr:helix-turn-helix domain-containing protein [Saccharothrix sp. NRRL B-16348]